MKNQELKNQIVQFVNEKTDYETLDEVSTKQVAKHFNIDTKTAYKLLVSVSDKRSGEKLLGTKQITHLDPVNGQNFDCCGWIKNKE